jgi:predicted NAD/FAD-binding protein
VIKTQMTFSISRDSDVFEWAGDGLRNVFYQLRRVFGLGMWRMLFDIMHFNASLLRMMTCPSGSTCRGKLFVTVQG